MFSVWGGVRRVHASGSSKCLSVLVLAAALLLQSCGGRPQGVMSPVAGDTSGAEAVVDMLVVTSRQRSQDPGQLFSGERSASPSVTEVSISIPPKREAGTVQWPKKLPPDPKTDFSVVRVQPLTSRTEALSWINQHSRNGHAMVFVHGFNNTYEDAVFRYAQIVHDSGASVTPILFTWPSRASVFDYNYDKESTNFSRTALEQALRALSQDKKITDITVLAHSMGTWLAMEALRQMSIRDGAISPKIQNVILASPDIDIDVFAKQWTEIEGKRPSFTVFVSQDDKALALSRFISGDVMRLGAIDASTQPYRSDLEKAGIQIVDLTQVKTEDRLNHGKFAESPEIVQLIGKRLVNGQTLTDSNVTLGEGITAVVAGTAGNIGKVAGTAVSTPVSILEQKKKSKKVEDLDETLSDAPSVLE
ncbi:alpha/beta hydrolase [Rhizobium setariae]